jgi:hypothetical protein
MKCPTKNVESHHGAKDRDIWALVTEGLPQIAEDVGQPILPRSSRER